MNFKKPISLLLIAGISIGISASDNNIKKDELKAKTQQNISNKDAYILRSFGFGTVTLYAIGSLRAGLRNLESAKSFLESSLNSNSKYLLNLVEFTEISKSELFTLIEGSEEKSLTWIEWIKFNSTFSEFIKSLKVERNFCLESMESAIKAVENLKKDLKFSIKAISDLEKGVAFCTLISLLGTIATVYYCSHSYQAWKNAKKATQELTVLEKQQEQDQLFNAA